jgi:prevent-host-death family protein
MVQVNIHEAKTHLSRLLAQVAEGQEIVIAKDGKPLARLVPFRARRGTRIIGRGKGEFTVREDFDAPLPAKVRKAFEP